MKRLAILLIVAIFSLSASSQERIEIRKLTDRVYLYTAWAHIGSYGLVGSNGLLIKEGDKTLLVDTPMSNDQTQELVERAEKLLKSRITHFVPGHWHGDCVGGLDYLHRHGTTSYANAMTNEILDKHHRIAAQNSFRDSVTLKINDLRVHCYFLGGGHATDNIVVWIPQESIVFGGCMLRDTSADNLGNTEDAAPLDEWVETVGVVKKKFSEAKIVVPGHGNVGGAEIFDHTEKLLRDNIKNKK